MHDKMGEGNRIWCTSSEAETKREYPLSHQCLGSSGLKFRYRDGQNDTMESEETRRERTRYFPVIIIIRDQVSQRNFWSTLLSTVRDRGTSRGLCGNYLPSRKRKKKGANDDHKLGIETGHDFLSTEKNHGSQTRCLYKKPTTANLKNKQSKFLLC